MYTYPLLPIPFETETMLTEFNKAARFLPNQEFHQAFLLVSAPVATGYPRQGGGSKMKAYLVNIREALEIFGELEVRQRA